MYKKDEVEDDPGSASRGNWWQGKIIYKIEVCSINFTIGLYFSSRRSQVFLFIFCLVTSIHRESVLLRSHLPRDILL